MCQKKNAQQNIIYNGKKFMLTGCSLSKYVRERLFISFGSTEQHAEQTDVVLFILASSENSNSSECKVSLLRGLLNNLTVSSVPGVS